MKKTSQAPVGVHSISELHKLMGLHGAAHPMISIIDNTQVVLDLDTMPDSFVLDFYKISYKKTMNGRIGYGQGYYDFDEGGLIFTAPHQVIHFDRDIEYYGSSILFHPDLLRNYPLGKNMNKYGFFSYDTREALHLSEKERNIILNIMEQIGAELETNIDDFSQDVIISYLEVLLNYSNRFYKRQFITRKAASHDLLDNMEQLLATYFEGRQGLKTGLPTVENTSPVS